MEFNGSDFKAYITGTPNKLIQKTRDLSISVTAESLDITTRDSLGWKRNLHGVRSWTASMSGTVDWVEGANAAGLKSMLGFIIGRTEIALEMGTNAVGDSELSGTAKVLDVKFSAPHEGVCEWTAELEGNGPILVATIA
jgi:predicted secreted protein